MLRRVHKGAITGNICRWGPVSETKLLLVDKHFWFEHTKLMEKVFSKFLFTGTYFMTKLSSAKVNIHVATCRSCEEDWRNDKSKNLIVDE